MGVHPGERASSVGSGVNLTDRRILTSWGGRSVLMRRVVAFPVAQVWKAVSDADRLVTWLGPVNGRLHQGSVVDFSGAVVQIMECRPPTRLDLRWTLMGETNEIHLELRAGAQGTEVSLEHAGLVNPAAVGYGPSWEERLQHLVEHLSGLPVPQHDCAAVLAQVQSLWWALLTSADREAMGMPPSTPGAE